MENHLGLDLGLHLVEEEDLDLEVEIEDVDAQDLHVRDLEKDARASVEANQRKEDPEAENVKDIVPGQDPLERRQRREKKKGRERKWRN